MNYKKLVIETDGRTARTKVFVDGQQLGGVQKISLSAEVSKPNIELTMDIKKQADGEFINQRKRLLYNDGNIAMMGDKVEHEGKPGNIVNLDRQTVNIKYDDGSGKDNVPIENVKKIAKHFATIQGEFIKEARS